ncbi:MAG: tetratricopeptide repeat protein, partial [bacterium]|nr:tetratricopeptide repeat protein [bacterium]
MINIFRWCVCYAIILILQFVLLPTATIVAAETKPASSDSFDQTRDEWTDVIEEAVDIFQDSPSQVETTLDEKSEGLKEKVEPEPSPESLNREGAALVKSGSMAEAVSKFNEALKLDPSHIGARFNLAFAYHRMERLKEAESEYRRVLEIKDLARAHLMLGLIYKEEGEDSNAINEFEAVLKKEPDNKVALARLRDLKNAELEKAERVEAERVEA